MINRSRRRRVPVPSISARKSQPSRDYQFVKGWNSNLSNDDMSPDQWRLAVDTRQIQVGKWQTRKAQDFFSVPIGEAVNVEQVSTAGAADETFSTTRRIAKRLVAASSGVLTAIDVNLKNTLTATGTIVVALYTDSAGAPGTLLASSTIRASEVVASYAYDRARFITCPTITSGTTYWCVLYVQDGGTNSYQVSSTTAASTGLVSTNSGQSWGAASKDYNVKMFTATAGGVKGHIRVKRPGAGFFTFFAHGSTLYSVNEIDGVTTAIDTGLSGSATYCRFAFVNDVLYYVTGLQKPRQYNFTTASEISSAPDNASNIIEHKGLLFFTSSADETKEYYSNFAAYTTFTSTDLLYVPAPKTADPITAKFKLNGALFFTTNDNKYVLYGAENATFRLDSAIGQKGTYSQNSVAYDEDNVYLANNEGIFRFNGAEELNISTDILKTWRDLLIKNSVVLELANNRLYVFYTPNGSSENSRCLVYHTLYGIWESDDTKCFVATTHSDDTSGYLIHGSNRCGMLMLAEQETNDFTAMGEPLSWELDTSYAHFDAPAQFKRVPTFRPHFDTVSGNYSVQVGYALDYNDSPTYKDISLAGTGPRFNQGVTFNSGATFGGSQQVNPMDDSLLIPGEWRRMQLRYKHEAAREPVSFDGHVIELETQRVI